MNIRKLSFMEWLQVLRGLAPYLSALIKLAGVNVLALIRGLIDIVGQVESLFPAEIGADGKPIKRSREKREAFIAMVAAGFATAEESVANADDVIGPIADVLSGLMTTFGVFKRA